MLLNPSLPSVEALRFEEENGRFGNVFVAAVWKLGFGCFSAAFYCLLEIMKSWMA